MYWRSVTAVCCALFLAGCGDQSREGEVVAALPAGPEAKVLRLPLDAYRLSADESAMLDHAADTLVEICMRGKGVPWTRLPRFHVDDAPHRRRYGVIEEEVAKRFGYHPVRDPGELRKEQAWQARDDRLTSEEHVAAYGEDGKSGCMRDGYVRVNQGAAEGESRALRRLDQESYDISAKHPEVLSAFRKWSACMREQGFSYSDPAEAVGDPRWRAPAPTGDEIRTAGADVRCKKLSNLVAVWSGVERELQERGLREHRDQFAALADGKSRWLEDAESIISRGLPSHGPSSKRAGQVSR
ncbi:hypothetical protein [Nonomuraea sp. B5E05]|uniref:hypothetical protein n=1 Tax=Nonomuraea sp. B5E05 TaxID=3153569 RepID=UPI003260F959